MAEINDFPSGTSSRPSHTLDRAAAFRNVFGEEPPPPPPPPPPPLARVSDVFWEQFLTERPGTIENNQNETANDEDESSLRSNEDGMESETAPSDHECGQMLVVPQCGMEFPSEERAYNFYKNYAARLGFKVRKGKVQRTSNGMIQKRIFLCSKEGERSKKISGETPRYKRKETRTGCKAEIRIELKNSKWVIYGCSLEHNHELERPGQRHESDTYPDNSQVSVRESNVDGARVVDKEAGTAENRSSEEVGQRHESDTYPDNSQVAVRESIVDGARVVDTEGGTAENRSPVEVGISNYFPDENVAQLPPEDVQRLLSCFSHLQVDDPSFFYAIQVDSKNRMTSFFWRDGRSRIDYEYFGDMLVLDTCRYQMDNKVICAPFFGVNHHKDLVLFGCAFLLDETVVSFRWLFRTFLEAMGYSQPKTLYTAPSEVIASAAEKQFPETKHRILLKFIFENGRKLLPKHFEDSCFRGALFDCIYAVESEQDFENEWKILMEDFELQEDPWLATLYKSWEKWSPVFSKVPSDFELFIEFKNPFHVFPSWTPEIATLSDVLDKYLERLQQLRLKELKSDSLTMPRQRRFGMEKHAVGVYTPEVFVDFKLEFEGIMSLAMEEVSPGPTCVFKLKDIDNDCEEEVSFDCSNSTVSCSCKKFERMGILCRHSLKVLNAKNIFDIPEQYVLKRWTRSAKQGVEVKWNSARDNMDEKSRRLHSRNLMYKALNVITKSVATEKTRAIVERHLDLALRETAKSLETKFWETDSRGDDVDNDEICCGERHCPFGKRKKIGSTSSSDNEVHESASSSDNEVHGS